MNNLYKILIGSGLATSAIVIFIYSNPKLFEHWMAIFDRVLYKLLSFSLLFKNYFDKRAVSSSIKDTVNSICEDINAEAPNALPHPLQIEWVNSTNKEPFISDGKAVVRLKRYANQEKNIVNATLMYLKVGLLPRSKIYLNNFLYKSCELKIASKILIADRYSGAFNYFRSNILEPLIKSNSLISHNLKILNDMDYIGFFTHIFLTEVEYAGDKLLDAQKTKEIEEEINRFAKFLQIIANKSKQEDVPLRFKGSLIKVGIVLIARQETIQSYGIEPYIAAISRNIKDGYESIYIGAWGKELINRVIEIKNELKHNMIKVLRIYRNYVMGNIDGIIVVCQPNYSFLRKQKQISDEFEKAVKEVVPLVKRDIIKVKSVARIRKIGCKATVRWSSDNRRDHCNAVGICIGNKGENIRLLHDKFPGEFIHFISWSENIKELILNTLFPINIKQVIGVEIDEINYKATVIVNSEEARRVAFGKYTNNVKLAGLLIGMDIIIVGQDYLENIINPEEELRQILFKQIPDIYNNKIIIDNISRIKGIGSKVIVKWNKECREKQFASYTCIGPANEYIIKIRRELKGELIYFHEYSNNNKKLILNCLRPLKENDVLSFDLDPESTTVVITVKDDGESQKAYWKNPINISSVRLGFCMVATGKQRQKNFTRGRFFS